MARDWKCNILCSVTVTLLTAEVDYLPILNWLAPFFHVLWHMK